MAATLFLDYDRVGLDREYDNRAKVSDFEQYLRRYQQASETARRRLDGQLDIAFGPGRDETLDLFPAAVRQPPTAVNVFFHGGYWKSLSKNEFSFVANGVTGVGAAAVIVNYGLIPAVSMDELVRQCRAAVAWVWRNAARFGADRERLLVSGHSAGGHLAAMMMATDWPAFGADLPADTVKGACAISGLYDLEPIRLCFLNDDLNLDPDTAARYSPIRLVKRCSGPVLLPVGGLEGAEYLRQSQTLAKVWGERCRVMPMDGIHHFSIVEQLDRPDSELSKAVAAQMAL